MSDCRCPKCGKFMGLGNVEGYLGWKCVCGITAHPKPPSPESSARREVERTKTACKNCMGVGVKGTYRNKIKYCIYTYHDEFGVALDIPEESKIKDLDTVLDNCYMVDKYGENPFSVRDEEEDIDEFLRRVYGDKRRNSPTYKIDDIFS